MYRKILVFMISLILLCGCNNNLDPTEEPTFDPMTEDIFDPNQGFTPDLDTPTDGEDVVTEEPTNDKVTEVPTIDDLVSEEPTEPEIDPNADYIVSRLMKTKTNKTYLEVDGKPFAIRGGQVRLDGLINRYNDDPNQPLALTDSEIEEYFKVAKKIGLNTLEIPIEWRRVEPQKDQYDFSLLAKILGMANKHDMKVEMLWFSTNMCGDSCQFQLPDYIFDDSYTYSRFTCDKEVVSKMYGKMTWLIGNDPDLMERESKVLTELMAFVYDWNLENGRKNPLIGVQVQNETDGMLRWRLSQRSLKHNGSPVDPTYMWNAILGGVDNAGKAVKSAQYKVYTRVNMTVTLGIGKFPEFPNHNFSALDMMALEGIDMVGDDAYNEDPTKINTDMVQFSVKGNYPHIAENMGDYASSPSLFLTTYQAGGSYMFYDMATPEYFIYLNGGGSYRMDQGLLNYDFSYKDHSLETINIINGIKKMDSIVPIVDRCDFAAFNVLTKMPETNLTQTICTSNLEIKYRTTNGGIAFAIEHEGYLYIYSTKDCNFSIMNAKYKLQAQIGYYNGSEFVVEDGQYLPYAGYEFAVSACKLYRFKITEYMYDVTSTTTKNA